MDLKFGVGLSFNKSFKVLAERDWSRARDVGNYLYVFGITLRVP